MKPQQRTVNSLLVTGGAGFIGSAFIRYLLSDRVNFTGKCINYDLLTYAGSKDNLSTIENDPRYTFVQGDVCDRNLVTAICNQHQIDTIIHFAAESHVDRSIVDPERFVTTNVMGTLHLLEVVRQRPSIHFHHISTDEVYGSLGPTGCFTEFSPYCPNSPYSVSKASADHLVRAYSHTYGLSTCISCCSNNYGPYQYPEKLIPSIICKCVARKPLPIYGTGENIRDWLYVDDHVDALWKLLIHGVRGETYNIGAASEKRNIDIVHQIIDLVALHEQIPVAELRRLVTFVTDRPGHDYRYAVDSSKVQKATGWSPTHTLSDGLQKTVDWYFSGVYAGYMQNR